MKSLSISEKYGWAKYIGHQVYYSLVNREFEWELMPLGVDQNVGTIVWSPLAQGKLGGKIRRGQPAPKETRVGQGGSMGPQMPDEKFYDVVDVLDAISKETGMTVAQISLNWLLQRPTVSTLVIGARNEEQLKLNLTAADRKLTPAQVKRLDDVSAAEPVYPYWHQGTYPQLNASFKAVIEDRK
jgi:aryl-alcohol dehydrogenase-like predicted oxidoreductase